MNQYIEVRLEGESTPERCRLTVPANIGDSVILNGPEGEEWGQISSSPLILPLEIECDYTILRHATPVDYKHKKELDAKVEEVLNHARRCAQDHNLDMNLTHGVYTFSGKKMSLYFSSQSRVDFRELLKDIWAMVHCRVELRQYRERDKARFHGGIGPCGRVLCCSRKTHAFKSVTINMAKTQGVPLSKEKGTGMCGQWFCCLGYEQEAYEQELIRFPKVRSLVMTPDGQAQVSHNYPLRGEVTVQFKRGEDRSYQTYPLAEIEFDASNEANCALRKSACKNSNLPSEANE